MSELVRLVVFPFIIVVAWTISQRYDRLARATVWRLALLCAAILFCLATTGWLRPLALAATIHTWTGHALIFVEWLAVPFAIGVFLERHVRNRPMLATAYLFVLLSLIGVTLLASFTGYLGPSYAAPQYKETRNRFQLLHLFVLPGLAATLVTVWFWLAFRGWPSATPGQMPRGPVA